MQKKYSKAQRLKLFKALITKKVRSKSYTVLDDYKAFLQLLGAEFKERAFEAKEEENEKREKGNYDYEIGKCIAFTEVIAIIQRNGILFPKPYKQMKLDHINPDTLSITSKKFPIR